MKKLLSLILCILMILTMTACTNENVQGTTQPENSENVPQLVVKDDENTEESKESELPEEINENGTEKPEQNEEGKKEPQQDDKVYFNGKSFEIHFIDVGQADCSLIICDGKAMLIDGGNVDDSSLVYSYLKNHGISKLEYVICTHAHEDHVGGLPAAFNACEVGCVYSPVKEYDTKAFENFIKYANNQNLELTVPTPGDKIYLGSSSIQFFGPVKQYDDVNNTSIVLKVTYGKTSFLFTGDAERESELDMINSGYDLNATMLKVGHHGSDSSSSYIFINEVLPKYAVICVGAGNSYGHPTDEVLSRLRDAGTTVYRTDLNGTIICKSDGETLVFTTDKTVSAEASNPTIVENTEGTYIGNVNSKKFHRTTCKSLPDEDNRMYFGSREEAVNNGYIPCKICKP